ncbi:hypothetical protein ACWDKQ_35035, partial [Saccharopolyspora sp. NPDC000995]
MPGDDDAGDFDEAEFAKADRVSPTDGDPVRSAPTSNNPHALKDPEAEPQAPVALPADGPELRRQGWGAGLPTEVTGPKRQSAKRPQDETGESSGHSKRHRGNSTAAKKKEENAEYYQKNKEKFKRKNADYVRNNPIKVKGLVADNYRKNKDEINGKQKALRRQPAEMIAKLSALSERNTDQQAELDLWQKVEADRKLVRSLRWRVNSREKHAAEWAAEIQAAEEAQALEKLPPTEAEPVRLRRLRGQVDELADLKEQLAGTNKRLSDNRKTLKSMQAQGEETGAGRIAGLEASGQQDAMVRDEVGEFGDGELAERRSGAGQGDQNTALADADSDAWRDEALTELGEQDAVEGAADAGAVAGNRGDDPGNPGDGGNRVLTSPDQAAQQDERAAERNRVRREAAARVAELEGLETERSLTSEVAKELAALQPKVAEELAALQPKVAERKQEGEVMETGESGVSVAGRDEWVAGPDGVSEWTRAQADDRGPGLADFDLGARLVQMVADPDVSRDAGAAEAETMLGEGAYEEFVETELAAFKEAGEGVGDIGEMVGEGGDDFAAFLRDYNGGEDSVGLFGGEVGGLPTGEAVVDEGLPRGVKHAGLVAGELGAVYRLLQGVNRDNYLSGDMRFRVNCLEAFVAFHNSLKFNRQFVAGPAGRDRDPARLVVAFGREPRRVDGVAGGEQYVRSGPVGVAAPVIYQRADRSAHLIAAVHVGDRDGKEVVVLLDPQKGEDADRNDALSATRMWVIPMAEVEPDPTTPVMLPEGGSKLRRQGWGAALPTGVEGPNSPNTQPGVSGPVAAEVGTEGTKRTREEADGSSPGASKRPTVAGPAGVGSGNQGGEGDGTTPTDQAAQQDPRAATQTRRQQNNARQYQARKADAAQLAELKRQQQSAQEKGKQLAPEKAKELERLEQRVEKWKQNKKGNNARLYQARKADAAQVADLQRKEQLAHEEGRELPKAEAERLEQLKSKVEKRRQMHRAAVINSYRAKKDADADEFAKLKKLEELGQLNPEQRTKLDLHREIEKDEKGESRLRSRVSTLKKEAAEVRALEALPRSADVEGQLRALRDRMVRWAGSAEELGETRERLKTNRAALTAMQARKETGPGEIAGVESGGQQNEQDAMASSEGSESAGADQDEQDTWSDGGVDLGESVDEVRADPGGEEQDAASLSNLDEDRQTGLEASQESDAAMQAEWEGESREGLDEAVQEQVGSVARDGGQDSRVAQLRESLEQAESYLASFEALPRWDEVVRADPALLPTFDQGLRAGWEETQRRIEALRAELAGLVADDEGELAGEHVGESWEGRAAGFVPPAIARLAELTGRMDRHLRAMPPEFNPNRVRANVETAKQWVRHGQWTPEQLQTVESSLGAMQAAERALRNARRARVGEVYVEAKRAIAEGRVPVTYFRDGVPGGVSSRPDVRLGFEVEFKLLGDNVDTRVNSLGAELEQAGLVDWRTDHGSKLLDEKLKAAAIVAGGKWALLKEGPAFEVEATSPILRNGTQRPVSEQVWPSMEKLLSALQRQGGFGSESEGHINVSFDRRLSPVQYVRVAQVAKVFEALLYRLGNVAGSDGSK